ncbi:MAG: hypothetical protein Ta2D_01480 [Rickettsiales bacterium]|nr:MAG: hypothetical protein Ta2D_01480 [Rickettsiales bacterium]
MSNKKFMKEMTKIILVFCLLFFVGQEYNNLKINFNEYINNLPIGESEKLLKISKKDFDKEIKEVKIDLLKKRFTKLITELPSKIKEVDLDILFYLNLIVCFLILIFKKKDKVETNEQEKRTIQIEKIKNCYIDEFIKEFELKFGYIIAKKELDKWITNFYYKSLSLNENELIDYLEIELLKLKEEREDREREKWKEKEREKQQEKEKKEEQKEQKKEEKAKKRNEITLKTALSLFGFDNRDIMSITTNEIRKKYLALVQKWHPDKNNNSAESNEKMTEINLAKEKLLDYK